MTGENHKCDCGRLDGQSVTGQKSSMLALCPNMDETHTAQISTLETQPSSRCIKRTPLSPCPSSCHCQARIPLISTGAVTTARRQQIAVRRSGQKLPFCPLCQKTEGHCCDEEGNGKMNQHHVLRVLAEPI